MKKYFVIVLILVFISVIAFNFYSISQGRSGNDLPKYARRTSVVEAAYNYSLEQMQEQVTEQRDLGIKIAIAAGVYDCCVELACTMCYMEDNIWNNQTAGTCACADLIGEGKDPCPQCERMLSEHANTSCQIDAENELGCENN